MDCSKYAKLLAEGLLRPLTVRMVGEFETGVCASYAARSGTRADALVQSGKPPGRAPRTQTRDCAELTLTAVRSGKRIRCRWRRGHQCTAERMVLWSCHIDLAIGSIALAQTTCWRQNFIEPLVLTISPRALETRARAHALFDSNVRLNTW